MYFLRVICLLFLVFFQLAWGENASPQDDFEGNVRLFDLNGLPSAVVGGCVNVISGHYFENDQDLATFGTNPVSIHRYYSSGSASIGELYDYWDLDINSQVKLKFLGSKKEFPYATVMDKGVEINLWGRKYASELEVSKKMLKHGIANACSPYLSGRNYLLNKRMSLFLSENNDWDTYFRTPGGETLHFGVRQSSKNYLLSKLTQPNGCNLSYGYRGEKVSRIAAFSRFGEEMGGVSIQREDGDGKERLLKLLSDDGKQVTYHISRMDSKHRGHGGKHRYCLTSMERNFAPDVCYHYEKRGSHKRENLEKKELPDNRYLKISYHDSGSKKRKVRALYAPVGVDERPVETFRFEYSKNSTVVIDGVGNRKAYEWGKDQRLSTINEFKKRGKLYRSEKMVWGKEGSVEESFLKARYLCNSKGTPLFVKTYQYDSRGNILEECLAGNLSGTSKAQLKVNQEGELISSGHESLIKTYSYDNNNLVVSEQDFRQRIQYDYYPNTALIRFKTVSDSGVIKVRYYYEYDSAGALSLEIIDNGTSTDINDLSSVTERQIKRVQTCRGLPLVIQLSYYDPRTCREVLIKRIVNNFTSQGLLAREEVYDCHNEYAFCREWEYDSFGHVAEETDPLGQKTYYFYDLNGNCIRKQTPNSNFYAECHYDFSNRLIKEEEVHADGSRFTKSYAYDYKGNRTKEVDIYGNETLFFYDCFDRLIKKVMPPLANESGSLFLPEETYAYNELNHPIEKRDAAGCVTGLACNMYGKPCKILYPDGSAEEIIYNLDGTLREMIDASGVKTVVEYDYLSRKVREEKRSIEGDFLWERYWIYDAFHLIQEIDPEGISTTYRYDGAGRQIACVKGSSETLYHYDSLGRQTQKWELYEEGKYRITKLEHDLLDRVVEERVESSEGEVFSQKLYGYDVDGNKTQETVVTSFGLSTTVTLYNSQGLPVKVIAPDGSETTFIYRHDYRDQYNVAVSYQQLIDPKGNSVTTVGNSQGKDALIERRNIFGDVVQKSALLVDPCGRLIRRIEDVIVSNERVRSQTTVFEYDPMGRETAVFEAYGTPLQKVTRKEYNGKGDIHKIIKSNGIVLEHEYDALGRLSELKSSDGGIHYRYAYDRNDNILSALGADTQEMTERSYDDGGRILRETLGNGLTLSYGYDPLGRLKLLTLPDQTDILYCYDARHLREVWRSGQVHKYGYDLSGKISSLELMGACGAVSYEYDVCLRPVAIDSELYSMEAVYDFTGNLIAGKQTDPLGEVVQQYGYDDLEQLTFERGLLSHEYCFDSLGNRVSKDGGSYEVNALNQLKGKPGATYGYDLNGNLTERCKEGERLVLKYDALDRLVEVLGDFDKTTYEYDPLHRRIGKRRFKGCGDVWIEASHECYLYQGDKEIGAADLLGNIHELRVMGIGHQGDVGAAVLLEVGGKSYVPLHDYRGNVVVLVDSASGQAVETYRYTAYGEELTNSLEISPWRFSSKRVDPETGWVFFGRRHYDPEVGRWTTPDPLWFIDGTNLYCYVANCPTQFIDPEGLFLESLCVLFKDTFMALFEWMGNGDVSCNYTDNGIYMCAEMPLGDRRFLDKRSHNYVSKTASYGPVLLSSVFGIFNSVDDAHCSSSYLQSLAPGLPISCVHNASHGIWDLVESRYNLLGINTRPVTLLHRQWDDYFDKYGESGIVIHACHSQGAILTRNALKSYDPERRKRIHVIAVAPAAFIDEDICGSIIHFISKADCVPYVDCWGLLKNLHNVTFLDKHPDAPMFDHDFKSPTYEDPIKMRIQYILKTYARII